MAFGNRVLNDKDKKKLFMSKEMKGAEDDEGMVDIPVEDALKPSERLRRIKKKYKSIREAKGKDAVKNFRQMIDQIESFSEECDNYGLSKAAESATSVVSKLKTIDNKLKKEKLTSITEFKEQLKEKIKPLKTLDLSEEQEDKTAKNTKSRFSPLADLEKVELKEHGKGQKIFLVHAPVIFTTQGVPERDSLQVLKKEGGLKQVEQGKNVKERYYYFENAPFVVGKKEKMNQEFDYASQLSTVTQLVNKKSNTAYDAQHAISFESKKFVGVLLVDANVGKPFTNFLDKVVERNIMVEY